MVLLASCARVGSPQGGDKDVTPPVLESSYPANESVNFSGLEVTFTFDEYVKLNNVQQQLVVSPALEELPEFKIKKKSLVMVLKQALAPNTTYNFNFGDAIVDVNENNPLKGFSYVISTGPYLDSLMIRGNVVDAFSALPQKEYTTALYAVTASDSTPFLKKPLYLTKTNERGEFVLRNLKEGEYKLLAINDVNKDYKFQVTEEIAFSDSLITANLDSTGGEILRSYKEVNPTLALGSKKLDDFKKLTVGLSAPCSDCKLIEPSGQDVLYRQWRDADQDTLFAQLKPISELDSITFYLAGNGSNIDTIQYYPPKNKRKRDEKRQLFTIKSAQADVDGNISFSFTEPIVGIENASMVRVMRKDSSLFEARLREDSLLQQTYYLDFPAVAEEQYTIYFPDSIFFGLYGAISGADTVVLAVQKKEYYGNLIFSITNKLESPALLLFTDVKTGITQIKTLEKGLNKEEFLQLPPSSFSLAVVIDENGNGKWDTGNYLKHIQPEKVINYTEKVTVRSNWDLELDWVLDAADIK